MVMMAKVSMGAPAAPGVPALPQCGERQRRAVLQGQEIGLLAVASRLPLEPAINRQQAAAQAEGGAERGLVVVGLGVDIDQMGTRPGVSRPGGCQTPVQPDDSACAVRLDPAHGKVLPGGAIVARGLIGRQRRWPHAVQVANPIQGQLLGDAAAHRRFLELSIVSG